MRKRKSVECAAVMNICPGDLIQCSLASCLCSQVSNQRTTSEVLSGLGPVAKHSILPVSVLWLSLAQADGSCQWGSSSCEFGVIGRPELGPLAFHLYFCLAGAYVVLFWSQLPVIWVRTDRELFNHDLGASFSMTQTIFYFILSVLGWQEAILQNGSMLCMNILEPYEKMLTNARLSEFRLHAMCFAAGK